MIRTRRDHLLEVCLPARPENMRNTPFVRNPSAEPRDLSPGLQIPV